VSQLDKKITSLRCVLDIDKVLQRQSDNIDLISQYYRKNRLAYKIFNSAAGFVHMGISEPGKAFSKADFYKQPELIQHAIDTYDCQRILELACGKKATLDYLADKNPEAHFYGLDLPSGQFKLKNTRENVTLTYGDYHDLSAYEDNSLDLVYVIEALCHASDKSKVIHEVSRILKPGGKFIVIDGYFAKDAAELNPQVSLACRLVAKSMMVTEVGQSFDAFRKYLLEANLSVVESENYSQNIMPSLLRLERKAKHLIDKPRRGKIIAAAVGDMVAANAIAGYLMPYCVEHGLFEYWYTLAGKPA
jgi:ubiquinone/menaquinone biosynthesis C-methylase UbiE